MTDWLARARALTDIENRVPKMPKIPDPTPNPIFGIFGTGYPKTKPARGDQTGWHRLHADLVRYWSRHGHLAVEQQRSLAWRETMHAWHLEHGERMPENRCAGCGERLSGKSLTLPDGALVHAGHGCLIDYGETWQARAAAALRALGILPPTEERERDEANE